MDESGFFDDFLVEMNSGEVKKVQKFDRMWRTEEGGSISSGVLIHENKAYFCAANRNTYCVDPSDGKLIWKFTAEGPFVECHPVISEGILYVTNFDRNIYALEAETGKMLWKYETHGKISSGATVYNGAVFFGGEDENVYSLDAKTGELIWKFRTYGPISSQPAAVNGKVYIGSYDHNAYCIDSNKGTLVWKLETKGEIHNTNPFLIENGVVYFSSFDNNVRAVNSETGKLLWKKRLGNYGMTASPVIIEDTLYVPTRDGILFALDLDSNVKWKCSIDEKDVIGFPQMFDGKLYIGSCGDYHLHCISTEGKKLWKFRTQYYVYERSSLFGRVLIFPSWDCNVYAINIDTRQLVWKFKADGSPSYVPPPYEAFELETTIAKEDMQEDRKKSYDLRFDEDEGDVNFYKSRITYQVSTQYAAKGKYQVDSREEEF